MSAAVLAPMPGSASKSAADAVLMLIGPWGAAAWPDALPLVLAGGADCAAVATGDWSAMSEAAARITSAIRNMSVLLVKRTLAASRGRQGGRALRSPVGTRVGELMGKEQTGRRRSRVNR